jgi:hypothetical protein
LTSGNPLEFPGIQEFQKAPEVPEGVLDPNFFDVAWVSITERR